jgi:isopentenyldiphosphate isomerase
MGVEVIDNPTQKLVCVDIDGRETGRVVDRRTAHTSPGVKHLAVQILVFTFKKEVILHERPMTKVGGGVLDAPTTHVWPGETHQQAAARCLKGEYGINAELQIKMLKGYTYDRSYDDGSCENEFCIAGFALYDGMVFPNKDHVVKIVRMPVKELMMELVSRPEIFPVWLRDTVRIVKEDPQARRFFD